MIYSWLGCTEKTKLWHNNDKPHESNSYIVLNSSDRRHMKDRKRIEDGHKCLRSEQLTNK
jgi:hypothetical protein